MENIEMIELRYMEIPVNTLFNKQINFQNLKWIYLNKTIFSDQLVQI